MRRILGTLAVLFAIGAFAGWWIADQIEGLDHWHSQ